MTARIAPFYVCAYPPSGDLSGATLGVRSVALLHTKTHSHRSFTKKRSLCSLQKRQGCFITNSQPPTINKVSTKFRKRQTVPLQPNYRKISRQITEKYRAKLPKNIAPNYRKIFLITMNQQITNRYYSHAISIIQDGSHRYRSACLPPPRRWCLCHSYWLYETLSSSGARVAREWLIDH